MYKSFLFLLLLITNSAFADIDKVVNKLKPFFPSVTTENIRDSELNGFYEVTLLNPIDVLYISFDGRYVIQGAVTDLELMTNLSSTRINSISKDILNAIDEDDKVVFKAENEQYVIHVFTDVDCPYCQKLHRNMDEMNSLGITIKYLASPIAQLHPTAQSTMEKIWCADDKPRALDNYKKKGVIPESEECVNPVAQQLTISKQLGVNGTPSLFFADGFNTPGYQTPEELINTILSRIDR